MAIVLTDFDKIWASTSPLTPYSFSDANYEEGWNFIGSTPPARQMWDSIQKFNDEKFKFVADNYLSVIGTVVADSIDSSVSVTNNTATEITHISLSAGTWLVTGCAYYPQGSVTADKLYGISITIGSVGFTYAEDGSTNLHASFSGALKPSVTRIVELVADSDVYLNAYANASTSVNNAYITAVRIK